MVQRQKSKTYATYVQGSVVQKHQTCYLWGYTLFINAMKVTLKVTQMCQLVSEMGGALDTSLFYRGNFLLHTMPTHFDYMQRTWIKQQFFSFN